MPNLPPTHHTDEDTMRVFQIHAKLAQGSETYAHADTMTQVCLAVKEFLDNGVEADQIAVNKFKGGDEFEIVSIDRVLAAGRHPSRGIFER